VLKVIDLAVGGDTAIVELLYEVCQHADEEVACAILKRVGLKRDSSMSMSPQYSDFDALNDIVRLSCMWFTILNISASIQWIIQHVSTFPCPTIPPSCPDSQLCSHKPRIMIRILISYHQVFSRADLCPDPQSAAAMQVHLSSQSFDSRAL
jgi:hypothetical protein